LHTNQSGGKVVRKVQPTTAACLSLLIKRLGKGANVPHLILFHLAAAAVLAHANQAARKQSFLAAASPFNENRLYSGCHRSDTAHTP
jgi:hypothetical protein